MRLRRRDAIRRNPWQSGSASVVSGSASGFAFPNPRRPRDPEVRQEQEKLKRQSAVTNLRGKFEDEKEVQRLSYVRSISTDAGGVLDKTDSSSGGFRRSLSYVAAVEAATPPKNIVIIEKPNPKPPPRRKDSTSSSSSSDEEMSTKSKKSSSRIESLRANFETGLADTAARVTKTLPTVSVSVTSSKQQQQQQQQQQHETYPKRRARAKEKVSHPRQQHYQKKIKKKEAWYETSFEKRSFTTRLSETLVQGTRGWTSGTRRSLMPRSTTPSRRWGSWPQPWGPSRGSPGRGKRETIKKRKKKN